MKALIFAAGVGSRLKPWTDSHPKALVEVGGKPMLQHVIENIISAGINDIIINIHHFGEQIIDFVRSKDFNARINFSDERGHLLETGGGLRKIVPMLRDESVLIHNADIITDLDLRKIVYDQLRKTSAATLLVSYRDSSRRIVFDEKGRMKGWTNVATCQVKPAGLEIADTDRRLSFDGIHVVSADLYPLLMEYRPADTPFSIMDFYIDSCRDTDIRAFEMPEGTKWFDVGKPATLEAANKTFS